MHPTAACLTDLPPAPPPNTHLNPYKAQRLWPPDFTKLSPKHQFRLERRYRRRAKLKWARPRWTKAVKLAQWGSSISILTYGVLFMDWGREDTPFRGIRKWFHDKSDAVWAVGQPTTPNLGPSSTVAPSVAPLQTQNPR